ncbi:hypothetical protein ACH5RR_025865 [Cinchona calisaya]|uniref:Nitrogen regulatory protein areA GATA-like domain-containing protein n=1 Tax=Cinchona calisaya TaxID=153742 RepID=A0ABD2Z0W0_9GENT
MWNLPVKWYSTNTAYNIVSIFDQVLGIIILEIGGCEGRHIKVMVNLNLLKPLLCARMVQYVGNSRFLGKKIKEKVQDDRTVIKPNCGSSEDSRSNSDEYSGKISDSAEIAKEVVVTIKEDKDYVAMDLEVFSTVVEELSYRVSVMVEGESSFPMFQLKQRVTLSKDEISNEDAKVKRRKFLELALVYNDVFANSNPSNYDEVLHDKRGVYRSRRLEDGEGKAGALVVVENGARIGNLSWRMMDEVAV